MAKRTVHILSEHVASQIAAGEVVERPASAVKELCENALDAGARTISVETERGGSKLIAVADDGSGMSREDAMISLRRHATSKIRSGSDLAAVRTLGFRGEALASIASVSRLRMMTRRTDEAHGTELRVQGGETGAVRACAMAPGTRVEVRDLFFNTPARLKFLKTVATEQGAVADAVQRLALANRRVAFNLSADGRVLLNLPRATSTLERVRQLFGSKLAGRMLPFKTEGRGLRVHGLATVSQESLASGRMVFTFVNRRSVRDRMLQRAIGQAYQTLLPRGRYPAVVLFVEVSAGEVDVNVHPMKTEVRFRSGGAVFDTVYHALRERLADQVAAQPSAANGERERGSETAAAEAGAGAKPVGDSPSDRPSQSDRPLRLVSDSPASRGAVQTPLGLGYGAATGDPVRPGAAQVPVYSSLRIIGQIFTGYIALEDDDGLLLIDQHAAHERVTFEKLHAELEDGGIRTQAMLRPEALELSPARAGQVMAELPRLRAMGFEVESFGPTTLVLKGAPAIFGAQSGKRLLADMIDSLGESGFRGRSESAFDDQLKQLACHGSLRVGRALEPEEIRELLRLLDRTRFKTNCPHGRPVHIRFGRGQIERMFRR